MDLLGGSGCVLGVKVQIEGVLMTVPKELAHNGTLKPVGTATCSGT